MKEFGRPTAVPWIMALVGAALVALFYTNATLYYFGIGKLPPPSRFVFASTLVTLAYLAASPPALDRFLRTPLTWWMASFAGVTILWYVGFGAGAEATNTLLNRGYTLLALTSCLVVFAVPGNQRPIQIAMAVGVLWGVGLNLFEVFHPLAFSTVLGRSAGFYVNPNISGSALLIGMLVSVHGIPPRLRGGYIAVVGVGILLTFSRAAGVLYFISIIGLVWSGDLPKRQVGIALAALGALALLATVGIISGAWDPIHSGVLNANTVNRMLLATTDASTNQREEVARKAWEWIQQAPVLGHGLGAAYSWDADVAPHNMYLSLMVDQGVLGSLIFIGLAWVVAIQSRRNWVLGVVLLLLGFFSHNILEDRSLMLCLALASTQEGSNSNDLTRRDTPS